MSPNCSIARVQAHPSRGKREFVVFRCHKLAHRRSKNPGQYLTKEQQKAIFDAIFWPATKGLV
jgi:hypothetical protein